MADKKQSSQVVSIDIQPFLMPGAIILSTIIFSISFLVGMNTLAVGGVSGGRTTTTQRAEAPTVEGSNVTLTSLVEALGVNVGDFEACYEGREFEEAVKADFEAGQAAGVTGTPGFVVGRVNGDTVEGYLISGALPSTVFTGLVNGLSSNDQAAVDAAISSYTDYVTEGASTTLGSGSILGDSGAKLAIVEYSDLECPFCQRHHNEEYPKIVSEVVDNGTAMYVFRDYPLSFHDPMATDSAIAARCVGKLGGDQAYYQFLDLYFEKTKSNGQGL